MKARGETSLPRVLNFRQHCRLKSGGPSKLRVNKTAALYYDATGADGVELAITPVGPAGRAIQRIR